MVTLLQTARVDQTVFAEGRTAEGSVAVA
jgi:hypothetical protein